MRLSSYSKNSAPETPTGLTGNPARDLANSFNVRVILFLMLHLPLAMGMELSPVISTVHGVIALLIGLRAALLGRTTHVMYSVAYIAAAEVLWRMSRAYLLWEYSKYAIVAIVFAALIVEWGRRGDARRLRSSWPLLLLVTLVPATVMAILYYGPAEARDPLSFNLSSYIALIALALYLWDRPINRETSVRLFLSIIAPTVGVTFLAIYYTITDLDSLVFVGAANWVTSGNYGPNQVSNMMGLGALLGSMLFIMIPRAWGARAFILLMTFFMLAQGVLTFSRGGIYSFVLAAAVFGLHLTTTPRARRRFLALTVLFGLVLFAFVYPFLDQFTGGSLSDRFSSLDTTGRLEVATADLQVFMDNPVLGVGIGRSLEYHATINGIPLAAHTEYTRLLAEHGLFGILAMLILVWMLVKRYVANRPGLGRGMTAAFGVWAMSIMVHSAMRLAVVPLMIALALVSWRLQAGDKPKVPEISPPTALDPRRFPGQL
ncbi:MAG: O-antigen ligase family protein [Anaerolineae bacterium]|uniref:O-antigen ligase family protein n=1 Tax=Promineifilum sp. TaxID=2664178 RepID=UPI001D87107E|nr:O-antigen ligase family protein [Anaerolineales bacterium]MCB8935604.1 O-antigen ligase family protein [Promineifilum sp.]MCO5180600.1 O-antigen ligase family protein [Promineifilum sp.]MCW5847620.1 O-antigen ligase family protein [Anaerolineae bacterium]